ncbi:MAG: hypothetical protein ACQEQO_09100 [Thermodesulfobacteriota bacterium]
MKNFSTVSPLKILESSAYKELGKGNLGVLMARAGAGKTSCLIHIALDKLFHEEKVVHISLKDAPEKVASYYNAIIYDLVTILNIENEHDTRVLFDKNRIIFSYLNESFDLDRLYKSLANLVSKINFIPNTLVVDGLDFAETSRDIFEGFKKIAKEFDLEVWFSALSHRHIAEVNEKGIPFPCNKVDDLFSLIVQLSSNQSGIALTILKDHDAEAVPDTIVRLDPNTYLVIE